MAHIALKYVVTGTRDGVDWPAPGEPLEVPDWEAADLIAAGIAVEAEKPKRAAKPETATAPKGNVETAS